MNEGTEQTSAPVEQEVVDKPVADKSAKDVSTAGGEQDAATKAEVAELYKDLGINAPVPSGKAKGRPKANAGGGGKTAKKDDASAKSGQGAKADDSQDKSKTASTSDKDGGAGDETDEKGEKVVKASGKDGDTDREVSDADSDDESRVSEDEPRDNEASGEAGQEDDEEDDARVKRPGKSNPEVERRFQKLTNEVREREERIEALERQLQESTKQFQEQQVASEDPEYTMEDFRKVRDENGDVFELDDDQAELAFRRWQDGYNQRKSEREAAYQHQQQQEQIQHATTQRLMESSAQAYDTLTGIMDEYPELNPNSPNFDEELS